LTQEAHQRSETDVLLQEQDQLQRALLDTKANGQPPLSAEDVVVYHLTRFS